MGVTDVAFNLGWWCVFGTVAALVARYLVPGRHPLGCFTTLALGIAGSVGAGLVGALLGRARPSGVEPLGILLSLCGALLVIVLYKRLHAPPRRRDNSDD
jgi:uncharacterized membrane protein YeaQ/YmgE (transglycosylase-associated protein family)